ncbi:thrombospondin type 3 repeat-containing protein [Candidatus Jorgensenbacteria bacterium]|nr:thrombospondin type 3 repeat-containing protein [Candidatus Jorgensenbacteria bacterium]
MKRAILFLLSIAFSSVILTVNAEGLSKDVIDFTIAYRKYKDVIIPQIAVPTAVEVSFDSEFIERYDFGVFDKTTKSFEPYFFKQGTFVNQIPVTVNTSVSSESARNIIDGDVRTYTDFPLPEGTQGNVQIVLAASGPITASTLTVLLDQYVALPNSIEIRANIDGIDRIVVAERRMDQTTVYFPKTISSRWAITLTYGQPLRITEFRLLQENAAKTNSRALRFLAQPTHAYRIYFDSDRQVTPPVGEAGNLAIDKDVLALAPSLSEINPTYVIADIDKDGVADIRDNCVSVANTDQADVNHNGRGDACDDFDRDGLINSKDNCPDLPNINQFDTDGDHIGDVCDKEESRITERYTWLPWVGIGFAVLVLVILFARTAKSLIGKGQSDGKPPDNSTE